MLTFTGSWGRALEVLKTARANLHVGDKCQDTGVLKDSQVWGGHSSYSITLPMVPGIFLLFLNFACISKIHPSLPLPMLPVFSMVSALYL